MFFFCQVDVWKENFNSYLQIISYVLSFFIYNLPSFCCDIITSYQLIFFCNSFFFFNYSNNNGFHADMHVHFSLFLFFNEKLFMIVFYVFLKNNSDIWTRVYVIQGRLFNQYSRPNNENKRSIYIYSVS